ILLTSNYAYSERASLEDLLFMDIDVVTASKVSEKLSDAPGVISVVTKDELERFGGTTLKDILERIPSLVGSTIYMTDRSVISVRGDQFKASSSHVLYLINGRPIREVQEGGIATDVLETFPVNIIERIEVIRGPGSVLYGSGAFSGIINIITKKAEKNEISVTAMAGESSAYNGMASMMYNKDDFNFLVAGKGIKKPDWEVEWKAESMFTGLIGTYNPTIPNEGNGSYLEMNYKNLRLMSSYHNYRTGFTVPPWQSCGISYWQKQFMNLEYNYTVNDKWNMDINTTYTRSWFWTSNDFPNTLRDSYEAIIEWTNYFNPMEKLRLVAGGLYGSIEGSECVTGLGQVSGGDTYNYALYLQADYWAHEKVKVIAGAQSNKEKNIDDFDTVPRVGVILYPVENTNIKVLYSQAFRAPSINERYMDFFPAIMGQADVKPEKVETYDIGINYHKEKLFCGINYFNSKQTDIIDQDRVNFVVNGMPINTYNNMSEIEANGVEAEGKYYVNKELLLLGSVLYQTSKNKDGVEDVTPIPQNTAKLGVSYKSEKGMTLSLFDSYQGSLDSKYNTGGVNPDPDAYNLASFYGRFDMKKLAGWNIGSGFAFLLQIDNLLGTEVWLPNWDYAAMTAPMYKGRTIYLGVEVAL
ncbi:MAG: TonB-dependent receptor, partial [Endomicrobiales bacterium]|nr:TonB-dependent receptor [Endomicrobiales bacterium]